MDYYIKKIRRRRAKRLLLIFVCTFAIFVIGIAVNIVLFSKANAKLAMAGTDVNQESTKSAETAKTDNILVAKPSSIETNNSVSNGDQSEQTVGQNDVADHSSIATTANGEYDYSAAVPENSRVDDSYFESSLFIGNSRTEGLALYSAPKGAMFYTHEGLLIDNALTKEIIRVSSEQEKISIKEALLLNQYKSIYVMFGMNELGWVHESIFIDYYKELIHELQTQQPEASIYIQSILPVTETKSSSTDIYTNARIVEFNKLIKKMCEDCKVYYLDSWQSVADANGVLPAEASKDGVHLVKKYTDVWLDYIRTHTVNR